MSWIQGRVASACAGLIGDRLWIFSICFGKDQSNRRKQDDPNECIAVSYKGDEAGSVYVINDVESGSADNTSRTAESTPSIIIRSLPSEQHAIFITEYSTHLESGSKEAFFSSTFDDTATTFVTASVRHDDSDVIRQREWQTNVGGQSRCHDKNCNSIYLPERGDGDSTSAVTDCRGENSEERVAVVNADCKDVNDRTELSRNNDTEDVALVDDDRVTCVGSIQSSDDVHEENVAVVNVPGDVIVNHMSQSHGDEDVAASIADRCDVVDTTTYGLVFSAGSQEGVVDGIRFANLVTDLTVHEVGLRRESPLGSESACLVEGNNELSSLEKKPRILTHSESDKTSGSTASRQVNFIAGGGELTRETSHLDVDCSTLLVVDDEIVSDNSVAVISAGRPCSTSDRDLSAADNTANITIRSLLDVGSDNIREPSEHTVVTPPSDFADSGESFLRTDALHGVGRTSTELTDSDQRAACCSSHDTADRDTYFDKTGDNEVQLSSFERNDSPISIDNAVDRCDNSAELSFTNNCYDSSSTNIPLFLEDSPSTRLDENISHNKCIAMVNASRSASTSDPADSETGRTAENISRLLHDESVKIFATPGNALNDIIQHDDVDDIGGVGSKLIEVTDPAVCKMSWPKNFTLTLETGNTDVNKTDGSALQLSSREENIVPRLVNDLIDNSGDSNSENADLHRKTQTVDYTQNFLSAINDKNASPQNSVAVVNAIPSDHHLETLRTPDRDAYSALNLLERKVELLTPRLPIKVEERIANGEVGSETDGGISSDDEDLVNCDLVSDEVLKAWKHHIYTGNEEFFKDFEVPPTSPTNANFLDCFSDNDEWFDDFDAPSDNLMTASFQRDVIVKSPPPYNTVLDQRTTTEIKPLARQLGYSYPLADVPVFSVVPSSASQVQPLIDSAVEICWQCRRYGEPLDTILPPQSYFSADELNDTLESTSRRTFKKLVFDLVAEVLRDIYRDEVDVEHHTRGDPWSGPVSSTPRRFPVRGDYASMPPTTIGAVGPIVSDHVLRCLGMTSRESRTLMTSTKWLLGRKANTVVDHMLVEELSAEEPHWIRYDDDVTTRKLQIADFIMEALIYDTTISIESIQCSRSEL